MTTSGSDAAGNVPTKGGNARPHDDAATASEGVTPRDAVVVAIASWAVPGLGYWLLGLRSRGITVGVCVITLFILGLLIGGVRIVEVPFYDKLGHHIDESLTHELRAKPWSIAQILAG